MEYMTPPSKINYTNLTNKRYCLAPSKYSKLDRKDQFKNVEFDLLSNLAKSSEVRKKINLNDRYEYVEIGDIDVNTGSVDYEPKRGFEIPSNSPMEVHKGDILISRVRTYRKGISYIFKNSEQITCSPAFFIIRSVDEKITKEYLYSILRHDFFVEQILSLQNRGMYPRLDKDTEKEIYIPIPKDKEVVKYLTTLTKLYVMRDDEIKRKHDLIIEKIGTEITQNQKNESFSYHHPTLNKLLTKKRLSATLYSEKYEKTLFSLTNYKNGFSDIVSLNYKIKRGQNLQISNIGMSVYSDKYKKGFLKLILSKNLTKCMTISKYVYLGSQHKLKTLKKGQILFTCRGDMGRCIVFCEDTTDTITNIDNVQIENEKKDLMENIFIGLIFSYLKNIGFIDSVGIAGSGADSLTKSHFSLLKIPTFKKEEKEEVVKLYFNPIDYRFNETNIEQDKEIVAGLSIMQLDQQMKKISQKINQSINSILLDTPVIADFSFLNT